MAMYMGEETSLEERENWVTLFKSLADGHRLQIIQHLLLGEHRVKDLVEHVGLAQSTVSTHVASLRKSGLLASHTHGRATYYTLAHPEETKTLLAAAKAFFDGTEKLRQTSQPESTSHD